jgi:Asp-tRNA(Asn)/Glu-tRNA(Gln) amidotransferase A subunit family amidase
MLGIRQVSRRRFRTLSALCRSSVAGLRVVWSLTLVYAEPDEAAGTVCAGVAADRMPVGIQIVSGLLGEFNIVRLAAALATMLSRDCNLTHWN